MAWWPRNCCSPWTIPRTAAAILNARATLTTLLGLGCVPVINENDSVATAEIRFGDNDRLAARVAEMVQADRLLLLSDIDGLYTADPRSNPAAQHIPVVAAVTPEIEAMGGEPPPGYSSGGMRTKLAAARDRDPGGLRHGHRAGQASRTRSPPWPPAPAAPGSWPRRRADPPASAGSPAAWRRWACCRSIRVPPAPWAAGRSLLPAGIRAVDGAFGRGDPGGASPARTAPRWPAACPPYAADDLRVIAGHRSEEIETLLGWRGRDEAIHRDEPGLVARAYRPCR